MKSVLQKKHSNYVSICSTNFLSTKNVNSHKASIKLVVHSSEVFSLLMGKKTSVKVTKPAGYSEHILIFNLNASWDFG